jgi:hypothetical protein
MGSALPAWSASSTSILTGAMDILYSSSANTLARLGAGTSGDVLTTKGTGSAPVWETPSSGGGNWVLVGEATNSGSSCTLSISPAVAQSDIILLCAIFRGSTSATGVGMNLTVNGETSSNYSTIGSYTDGSSTTDFGTSGQGEWSLAMSGSSTQDTQIISYISCTVGSKITSQSTFSATNEAGMQTGYLNVGSSTSFDEIKFTDGAGGDLFADSNLVVYKLTT